MVRGGTGEVEAGVSEVQGQARCHWWLTPLVPVPARQGQRQVGLRQPNLQSPGTARATEREQPQKKEK